MEEAKAVKFVKSLINLVGVTAGIIIASIGAIMFLNAIFNLYLFGIDKPKYNDYEYRCDVFDIDKVEARILTGIDMPIGRPIDTSKQNMESISKLTDEQKESLRDKYKQCKEKASNEMMLNFRLEQKRSMATGLAFMIVGFPLIYFYQRKKRS